MRPLRLFALLAAAVTVLSAFAPLRSYHAQLRKSSPAAHDTIASPSQLKFWFSERPVLSFTKVSLKNPVGVAQPLGPATFGDTSKTSPVVYAVTSPLPRGTYTVSWQTAADDGHPSRGKFEFVVK